MPDLRIKRRHALAGALTLPAIIGRARAQSSRVVIETWGGDYGNLLHANVEVPLLQPKGIEVVQDLNDEPPRISKLYAQRRLPHGTSDVVCIQAVGGYQVGAAGLMEKLDESNVPNLAHVHPNLRADYYAPHIWSPQVLIYDPDRVKSPPSSFADLIDPRYKGRVGFPDLNNFYITMAASLYASGNTTDFDKAKALMEKVNANGAHLYPSTDSAGPPFKTGEIDIGVMWLARVNMWQNAGIPVKAAFPKEGCILYISGMGIPKNAPNKQGAFAYLNAMLEPSAQQAFAAKMGYLPTVDNAPLTGKVAEQLALPTPAPKMVVPDYAVTAKAQAELQDWWQKTAHGT